ncbi:MAG: 50S ribosomal protein L15 [Candidatus Limnocylindria bacterium]
MKLHDLHPAPGSRTPSRRVGRGHGSGRGKTAGRGTKGQKSRAGGNIPAWFEGGQTPLHVRTPKLHGFRNRGRVAYAPLNLAKIADAEKGTLITPDVLEHDGLIRDTKLPVKVLGVGDAPKGVTIHAHAFSKSALDKLAAAGSSVQRLNWPDNTPVDEEADAKVAADIEAKAAVRLAKRKGKAKGKGSGGTPPATESTSAEPADEPAPSVADDEGASESEPQA